MEKLDTFLENILGEGAAGQAAYEKMGKTSQAASFAKREQQLAGSGAKAKTYNLEQIKSYLAKLKELKLPKNIVIQAVNEIYGAEVAQAPETTV